MNKEQICSLFNCTLEQLNAQYNENAKTLDTMRVKANKTGKKVNGFNESQLTVLTDKYKNLSK